MVKAVSQVLPAEKADVSVELPYSYTMESVLWHWLPVGFPQLCHQNIISKKIDIADEVLWIDLTFKDHVVIPFDHLKTHLDFIVEVDQMVQFVSEESSDETVIFLEDLGDRLLVGFSLYHFEYYIRKDKMIEVAKTLGIDLVFEHKMTLSTRLKKVYSFKKMHQPIDHNELILAFKDKISRWSHSVFLPRNDEEVIRNMLVLGEEVRYVEDLPHVILSFERQSRDEIFFNIVLCRMAKDNLSLYDVLPSEWENLTVSVEKLKELGVIRQKFHKELSHLRIRIKKEGYFRSDYSLDLLKARHTILDFFRKFLGPLRDFNGGMVSREKVAVKEMEQNLGQFIGNKLLFENLFYAIEPHIMRTLVEAPLVFELYKMSEAMIRSTSFFQHKEIEEGLLFLVSDESDLALEKIQIDLIGKDYEKYRWGTSLFRQQEMFYLGIIYCGKGGEEKEKFIQRVSLSLKHHLHIVLLSKSAPEREQENSKCGGFDRFEAKKLIANI